MYKMHLSFVYKCSDHFPREDEKSLFSSSLISTSKMCKKYFQCKHHVPTGLKYKTPTFWRRKREGVKHIIGPMYYKMCDHALYMYVIMSMVW